MSTEYGIGTCTAKFLIGNRIHKRLRSRFTADKEHLSCQDRGTSTSYVAPLQPKIVRDSLPFTNSKLSTFELAASPQRHEKLGILAFQAVRCSISRTEMPVSTI